MRPFLFSTALLVVVVCGALGASADSPPARLSARPNDIRWVDAPPSMPKGTKVAVLEGDPKGTGVFTMRLKVPAGFRLAPHSHSTDERVTVLSGSVFVGFGDQIDEAKSEKFEVGSFYVNPPNVHHYVWSKEEAILQITGLGPWTVSFVDAKK